VLSCRGKCRRDVQGAERNRDTMAAHKRRGLVGLLAEGVKAPHKENAKFFSQMDELEAKQGW
jgi:hypothetical protein